jgi:hypothetical protein
MARPQVADGGHDVQVWRLSATTLNKQLRRADKGLWASSSVAGHWANNSYQEKNKLVTKYHKGLRTWTDSFDKLPKLMKMDMRLGTSNVRSLQKADSLMRVVKGIFKI